MGGLSASSTFHYTDGSFLEEVFKAVDFPIPCLVKQFMTNLKIERYYFYTILTLYIIGSKSWRIFKFHNSNLTLKTQGLNFKREISFKQTKNWIFFFKIKFSLSISTTFSCERSTMLLRGEKRDKNGILNQILKINFQKAFSDFFFKIKNNNNNQHNQSL